MKPLVLNRTKQEMVDRWIEPLTQFARDVIKEMGVLISASPVLGPRRRLNLISGANMAVTAVDNPGQEAIDITFVSSGGSGVSDGNKGDITVSGGGTVWDIDPGVVGSTELAGGAVTTAKIAADNVTNTELANMAQATIKGRAVAAGTGDPTDLTPAQATAILDAFTSALKGLAPASGGGTTNFLRADGTWAAPGGGSADIKAATLALGYGLSEYRVLVVDGTVTGASQISVWWGNQVDTDENSASMDDLSFQAIPDSGTGNFYAVVSSARPFGGSVKINYMVA